MCMYVYMYIYIYILCNTFWCVETGGFVTALSPTGDVVVVAQDYALNIQVPKGSEARPSIRCGKPDSPNGPKQQAKEGGTNYKETPYFSLRPGSEPKKVVCQCQVAIKFAR